MRFKVINEVPFGVTPITPEEFATDKKCVLLDLAKPMFLAVDNSVAVAFPEGLVDVPVEPSNALIAAGARVYGYESSPAPKVQMRAPAKSRQTGY